MAKEGPFLVNLIRISASAAGVLLPLLLFRGLLCFCGCLVPWPGYVDAPYKCVGLALTNPVPKGVCVCVCLCLFVHLCLEALESEGELNS